jgi:hypothetical protein
MSYGQFEAPYEVIPGLKRVMRVSGPQSSRRRGNRRPKRSGRQVALVARQPQAITYAPSIASRPPRRRARGPGRLASSMAANPYLATICNPDEVRGIKVPDPITYPSGTYCFEADGTTPVGVDGNIIIAVNPWGVQTSGSSSSTSAIIIGPSTALTSGFGTTANPLVAQVTNPSVAAMMANVRVVSAQLEVFCLTSPLNTTGRFCTAQLPHGTSGLALATFAACSALPFSFTDHAAKGACVRWLPADVVEHEYSNLSNSSAVWGINASGNLNSTAAYYSGMFISGSGLAAGSVGWRIVCNYEYLPAADAIDFVNPSPSPSNPNWMSQASTYLQANGSSLLKIGGRLLGAAMDVAFPGLGTLAQTGLNAGQLAYKVATQRRQLLPMSSPAQSLVPY